MHGKENFEFFSSPLQTLPLSSMLTITVLEHSPFPSACLHTPAHAVPLPGVSPCAEYDAVLGESNPARHRDDLTLTSGRQSAEAPLVLHHEQTLYLDGFTFPCSTCPQPPTVSLGATHCMYPHRAGPSIWGCTENTSLFHFYLEGEACVRSYSRLGRSTALEQD